MHQMPIFNFITVCYSQSRDEAERLEVTTMLAKMFSDEDSDLAKTHKSLWLSYLGR